MIIKVGGLEPLGPIGVYAYDWRSGHAMSPTVCSSSSTSSSASRRHQHPHPTRRATDAGVHVDSAVQPRYATFSHIQYNAECKLLRLVCKTDRRRKLVERNFSLLKKNKRCRSFTSVSENRVRTCSAPTSINSQRVARLLFFKRRLRNAYIAYSIADWLNYGAPVNDVTINTARYDCKPW